MYKNHSMNMPQESYRLLVKAQHKWAAVMGTYTNHGHALRDAALYEKMGMTAKVVSA